MTTVAVATDGSPEGGKTVEVARLVAGRLRATLSPVFVRAPTPAGAALPDRRDPPLSPELTTLAGVPAIEIVRFASAQNACLIVLSCAQRWIENPFTLGDTCDAVIRRADVPCLIVPPGQNHFDRMLACLDGSERGMSVLRVAWTLRDLCQGNLSAVVVEPPPAAAREGMAAIPSRRGEFVRRAMGQILPQGSAVPLRERRGNVADLALEGLSVEGGDVLAVGVRRGSTAALAESTGAGRQLLAAAPCAVLTIPL